MNKLLTGIPNIDRLILSYAGDDIITSVTSLNHYTYHICHPDFWKECFYKKYNLLLETNKNVYRIAYTTLLTLTKEETIKYCAQYGYISLLSTLPRHNSTATLNYAIRCNQLATVQHLLNIDVVGNDDSVDLAIKYATLPVFKELFHTDINISIDTFLNAIRYSKSDIVEFFINGGLDENTRNYAIIESLMVPNIPIEIIKCILGTGIELTYQMGDMAIKSKNVNIVKMIIQYGLNIKQKDGIYLRTAVTQSTVDIVKILLLYGIPVNKKYNLLQEAVFNRNELPNHNIEIIKLLCGMNIVSKSQLTMSLLFAAENGISSVVRTLLNTGLNVNCKRGNALILAIQGYYQNLDKKKEYTNTITLLLKGGANVNTQEGSPILLAAKLDLADIIELLVSYGADTRVLNPSSCVKYNLRITGGGTIYCLATSNCVRCSSLRVGTSEYCDKHTGGYMRSYSYY